MFMRLFFNLIIVCFLQFLFMKGPTKYKRTQMVPSKPAEPSEISEAQRAFQVGKLTMLFSYVNIFTNLFAHVYALNILRNFRRWMKRSKTKIFLAMMAAIWM